MFQISIFLFLKKGPQRRRSSVGVAMDSLKFAASKVKKSPKALKVKIDNALNKDSKWTMGSLCSPFL